MSIGGEQRGVLRGGDHFGEIALIDEGVRTATVTIAGEPRATLTRGDHFGEIALIDEGARMATITATTDLVCQGLTLWEFRPLVQENGAIGWKVMQTLARELRAAEQALANVRAGG